MKRSFFPGSGRIDTAVRMHDWTAGEEAIRQLHNNVSKQYWTSPGGNTPQGNNYTATCLPSRKLSTLDKPPHMAEQKQDDQPEPTYSSSARIRDVALKTCRRRWTIGRSGERGSGISVLAARHGDDDYR